MFRFVYRIVSLHVSVFAVMDSMYLLLYGFFSFLGQHLTIRRCNTMM